MNHHCPLAFIILTSDSYTLKTNRDIHNPPLTSFQIPMGSIRSFPTHECSEPLRSGRSPQLSASDPCWIPSNCHLSSLQLSSSPAFSSWSMYLHRSTLTARLDSFGVSLLTAALAILPASPTVSHQSFSLTRQIFTMSSPTLPSRRSN